MEIEVGEYVRTNKGKIIKCTGFGTFRKEGQNNRVKTIISGRCHYIYDYIVKHSKNIIDLIEEGDYVNGERVFATENRINDNGEKVILVENYDEWTDNGVIANKDIKSVVTKEQFESITYKVKE